MKALRYGNADSSEALMFASLGFDLILEGVSLSELQKLEGLRG
jgi:hypothetical protein